MAEWFLVGILFIALVAVLWQYDRLLHRREVSEGRFLSQITSHDLMWSKLVTELEQSARLREDSLRDEIRSLTQALGQSKEAVYIAYPRRANEPLEPSPGWWDRKPDPTSLMGIGGQLKK